MTQLPNRTTRVVLVDDHPLFLVALELSLRDAGVDVVGAAGTGAEGLALVREQRPDAVLLDLAMPGLDGLTCVRRLAAEHPAIKVVVVSSEQDDSAIGDVLAAGAVCFVGKCVPTAHLVHALLAVTCDGLIRYRGDGPAVSLERTRGGRDECHGLTKRELEILRLAANGASNSQLARSLWVTEQTVKFHLSNVYRKLGVANRTAASAVANTLGLLDVPASKVVEIGTARGALG